MKEHTLTLQVLSNKVQQIPTSIVQNDSDTNVILISLVDATNNPYSLGAITSIGCKVLKENGNIAILGTSNVVTTDWANGKIKVTLPSLAVSQAGVCQAVIEFYDTGRRVTTARFSYLVTADIMGSANQQIDVDTAIQLTTLTQNAMGQFESFKTTAQAAESTRVGSENTRVANESSRSSSESTRSSNESTRIANESTRVNSESARANAENTRISKENARIASEDTRNTAESTRLTKETARINAESTRVSNEDERKNSELLRKQDENSREIAELNRETSEYNRNQEELTRQGKEAERLADETQRVARENTRVANESDRVLSEDKRKENEAARVTAENNRVNTEATRVSNENSRTTAETTRASNEAARINAESTRGSNESTRVSNESTRVSSETARAAAETTRKTNETARVSSETTRASNEAARVNAEAGRVTTFNAQVATIAEKTTTSINGEQSNVNFIRNEIVKDGLVLSQNIIDTSKDFTIMCDVILEDGKNSIATIGSSVTGGIQIGRYGTDIRLNISNGNMYVSKKLIPVISGERIKIILFKKSSVVNYTVNNVTYNYNISDMLNISTTLTSSYVNSIVYNRTLTPQEINHNFNVLSNSQSINKINDYTISTDADHVEDRAGRVQDTINRVFYKQSCKEFTSSGTDIVVNNGMDGYVLSATLQGNTIKNYVSSVNDYTTEFGLLTGVDGLYRVFDINREQILATSEYTLDGKEYTAIFINDSNTKENNNISIYKDGVSLFSKTENEENILKYKFTSVSGSKYRLRMYKKGAVSQQKVACMLLEGDWTNKNIPLFYGLNSTQAVVYNNNLKYSFVKDGAVIELGGTATKKDTLEVKEDGSAIYTQNTKNNEDGSARVDLVTPVVTSIDKSLVPTILTQLSNTFGFGDAVKPSKVTISVPVNRIADLETRLAQLEALVTSTSNLSLMANYVDDEYNNSLNQM